MPYDLLISAAFNSNLSRQEIKFDPMADDYNGHLLEHVARLFRDQLLPELISGGTDVAGVLRLLDRRNDHNETVATGAAQSVYETFKAALAQYPFVPTDSGSPIPIPACVVPPSVTDPSVGVAFRQGPNRALFNLSRLDVPCRSRTSDNIQWIPAYLSYLGEDWVGEASFERVCKAIASVALAVVDDLKHVVVEQTVGRGVVRECSVLVPVETVAIRAGPNRAIGVAADRHDPFPEDALRGPEGLKTPV